jgi:hypothetical protein
MVREPLPIASLPIYLFFAGHTIVPGHIPVGTLLYHGRGNSAIPTHPEWTATDPEHAFPWCRDSSTTNSSITGCWQLTLVATRPLKVLHFDGTSGAKMKDGPLDAQDLIIWGEVAPTRSLDERARINDLCAWGKGLGIDGYVRCAFLICCQIILDELMHPQNGNGFVGDEPTFKLQLTLSL